MTRDATAMLVALVYGQGEGAVVGRVAQAARAAGLALAGMIQKDERRPERRRCDMALVDLASAREIAISQDRGKDARGCRLDHGALEEAAGLVMASLAAIPPPQALILSKFGKREIEGHGFRQVVEQAVERGVPVLVGVGVEHVEGFRAFAGEYGTVIESEDAARAWLATLAERRVTAVA